MIRKREGFEGQRAIVLPIKIVDVCKRTSPVDVLYITDIGFYPRAEYHYRERPFGIPQNILIYCIEGKGWLELESGKVEIKPNEYMVIPSNMAHKYGADIDNPWSIYWIHFGGNQALPYVQLLSKQFKEYSSYVPFLEERIKIFDSIYNALESGYSLDNITYSNISFAYFLATFSFFEKFSPSHQTHEKDPIDLSIEFMQQNLHRTLTLETIASSINLSVSHYSNMFRKKTGYSPVVYFNHLKIQHACQYLQFTALRINEISQKLGIEDQYYFSRMFTKIMGISPAEYRKKKH